MKPLVNFFPDRPLDAAAELKVGLRSMPCLADHGFQDMIVLPGAFYIDMALRVERELSRRVPRLIRNATFHNPIILSAEDTVLKVQVKDHGDGRVEYSFYEGGREDGGARPPDRQFAARLEIERPLTPSRSPSDERETGRGAGADAFGIETFQAQAPAVIDSTWFYRKLRENGNQYGPHFQNVSAIWRAGDQSLGKISVASEPRQTESDHLHPSLLDSVTQLLASFIMEKGKTFVLRAIEKIEISNVNFPDTLWAHATLRAPDAPHAVRPPEPACSAGWQPAVSPTASRQPCNSAGATADCQSATQQAASLRCHAAAGEGLVGNVRVFDQSGKTQLELSGVTFTLLDRVDAAGEKTPVNLVVAANFTAEPLEDPLNFWGDHFGVPVHTEFAPYNQVFQQLLDAGSAFRRNRDGVNVILLGLEEWANPSPQDNSVLPMQHETVRSVRRDSFERTRGERCFGDRPRYVLPNGLEIVHLNQYETDYVYQEIFEDQCYLKHGIRLQDGDTVVDIGANIGLFSLFVMSHCQDPKIYAFEPAPVVYDLLKANCQAHGSNVRALNFGVSDQARTATFTFYEKSSVFSGFHADEAEDRAAIQTVVRNMLNGESAAGESVDEYVNELTADRLRRRTCECQLISVSDIIREHQIDTIHLLKIDAEKSELDILRGIADRDWPKISQIVMEIHDRTGEAVKRIEELLGEKGFRCAVEHEKLLERSGLFNLYATRCDAPNRVVQPFAAGEAKGCHGITGVQKNLGEFCNALRSFTKQSTTPVAICVCPRSPAAEGDAELKAALNEAEQALLSEAGTIPNVHTISSAMLLRRHPVNEYYDPHSHELGHIPYTPECYAAIGTALFRTIFNLKRRPFKVIVLDCDNTLWQGACGEDGPQGIEISPPFRALQEFMIEQMNAGVLLCLCSKNNERDVWDVFDQRTDMPLKRDHLVSWRINWNRKSENIKALAQELNLGPDSFIFVDDNPVECAEVRIHCPEVLTLQLPRNAESFPAFLNHVWAFDHSDSSEEDHQRTRMYQESVQRRQFREQSLSLKDYVKGLQLRVAIAEATEDQLGRVSQLTFRTNQFNFTTLRRSEKELRDFLNRDDAHCLVVHVTDRFGDYGLVGVVMYVANADRFKVDTLLLSCRVLGRGVEHAVVSHLGQRAVMEGKRFVELTCLPTEKNQPAREFIASIADRSRTDGSTSWVFPAERLAGVEYHPEKTPPNGHEVAATVQPENLTPQRSWGFDVDDLPERLQRIGEEWWDTSRLAKSIEEYRLRRESSHVPLTPPAATARPRGESDGARENPLPTALLNIWRKVLGRPGVGMNDNFFEAGGTSLRAVQVIAMIKKELKLTLSIVSLFECPTVALLAARLGATPDEPPIETATAGAAVRGQQRRHKTMKRQAA